LTVDLGDSTATETDIEDASRRYIGGRGLGTKLAHDRIPFDVNPLGPDNRVFFTTGPMQTSNMSFTGRMNCTPSHVDRWPPLVERRRLSVA